MIQLHGPDETSAVVESAERQSSDREIARLDLNDVQGMLHYDYRNHRKGIVAIPETTCDSGAYSRLFYAVECSRGSKRGFFLGITSAIRGEGKTQLAVNLARHIARYSSLKVLLVDTNLDSPEIHARFHLPASGGLAELLSGEHSRAECLVNQTDMNNLSILTAGTAMIGEGRSLVVSHLGKWTASLQSGYDYILWDLPPICSEGPAAPFARQMDGVLFVVRAGEVHRTVASRALRTIAPAPVLGVVLYEDYAA